MLTYSLKDNYIGEFVSTRAGDCIKNNCHNKIMIPTVDWLGTDPEAHPPASRYLDLPVIGKFGKFELDVTTAFNAWSTATVQNFGFLFAGSDERPLVSENVSCTSLYQNAKLLATY